MSERALPTPDSPVRKGTRLIEQDGHTRGPGTYESDGFLHADRDGVFRVTNGLVRVVPPRPQRSRRGQRPSQDDDTLNVNDGTGFAKGIHRHGMGKHGTLRGKKKKGFGDQGTWD